MDGPFPLSVCELVQSEINYNIENSGKFYSCSNGDCAYKQPVETTSGERAWLSKWLLQKSDAQSPVCDLIPHRMLSRGQIRIQQEAAYKERVEAEARRRAETAGQNIPTWSDVLLYAADSVRRGQQACHNAGIDLANCRVTWTKN